MLKIEFTDSPCTEIIDTYSFFQQQITLGNSICDNLVIKDSKLTSKHIMLTIKEAGLFISGPNQVPFIVNGKKIKGTKKLMVNDIILIGATEFKITDFSYDSAFIPKDKQKLLALEIEKNKNLIHIINIIENEIINSG